jgi:hypothetical protein
MMTSKGQTGKHRFGARTGIRAGVTVRTRAGISCSIEGGEAPLWQGARRAHTRRYVTDEQRSHSGWIVVVNEHVIPARVLKGLVIYLKADKSKSTGGASTKAKS